MTSMPTPRALVAVLALVHGMAWYGGYAHAAGQSAHVHGHASLQVATEGRTLELYFDTPAVNIVGFEHAPRSNEQRARVDQAAARFRTQALVRLLDADNCEVIEASVRSELIQADHGDDDHQDHHGHGHASFEVNQRVGCDGGSLSGPVHATVMDAFKGIERLQIEWLSDRGQGAATLTGDQRRFRID